jgi:hypothetical protein
MTLKVRITGMQINIRENRRGNQSFIGGRNRTTWRKTIRLSQVTDKLHHINMYHVHLSIRVFELATLGMLGTDCTGSNIFQSGVKHKNPNHVL